MPVKPRAYVRQMPRIYGNLQPVSRPGAAWIGLSVRLVLIFGVAGYCLFMLFFSSLFRVQSVSVEGVNYSSATHAAAAVPIGVNMWLISAGSIRAQILTDPVVQSVAVFRGLPHTVRVTVTEQPVAAIWQTGTVLALLNNQGRVFKLLPLDALTTAPLISQIAVSPVIIDSQNLPVHNGENLLSPQFISFVTSIQNKLTTTIPGLHPAHFSVVNSTYAVTLITKEGPQIQLSSLYDPLVQLRNLSRLMDQEKLPATAQIDLRVNRWAYVHE